MKSNNKKEKLKAYVSIELKSSTKTTTTTKNKKKLMLKIFLFPSVVHVFCIAQKIPISNAVVALETIVTVK